jgi:hypothetical protein
MSRAEIRDAPRDPGRAAEFLDQARRFVGDAEAPGVSAAGTCILLYQACVSAMDAVLTYEGRTVGAGEASHIVRIGETLRLTGDSNAELFERLQDEWRVERGEVSYGVVVPPEAEVESQRSDTRPHRDRRRAYSTLAKAARGRRRGSTRGPAP